MTEKKQFAPRECACGCGQRPRNWQAEYVIGHRPRKPLAERLWSKIRQTDTGCWEYTGFCHPTRGYGQIGRGRREEGLVETHRAAWEITHGPIPEGLVVRHRCDNPPCCNPSHLELGTHQDNVNDAVARGRTARGDRLPQTRLTEEEVRAIREAYRVFVIPGRRGRHSNKQELADQYGISPEYVMQLVHGHYRKDVA